MKPIILTARVNDDGILEVNVPVGPCPYKYGSAHCSGGRRQETLRWNGTRFVLRRARVECVLPRLDPAHGCRR